MPSFQNEFVAVLKRVMLQRAPECFFTDADIEAIVNEIELEPAQIIQWAVHFQYRYSVPEQHASILQAHKPKKSTVQLKRAYTSFFNGTNELLTNITWKKSRNASDAVTTFSSFALNRETGAAEGVIEFNTQVYEHQLEYFLTAAGAAGINIITFKHNDGSQSAGAALARIWKIADKPGFELISQGECNQQLLSKAEEIVEKENPQEGNAKVDEKIHEAAELKESLKGITEAMATKEDLTRARNKVHHMLAEINTGVTTTIAAKDVQIETMASKIENQSYTIRMLNHQIRDVEAKRAKIEEERQIIDQDRRQAAQDRRIAENKAAALQRKISRLE